MVSLLDGPAAGQWRRVVQAIDSTAYLVDAAIPQGNRNRVDLDGRSWGRRSRRTGSMLRGGQWSTPLVLAGNQFGARVIKNHFLGGEFAFALMAFPTETPVMWGWSHTPYPGGRDRRATSSKTPRKGGSGSAARRAAHQDEPGPGLHDGQAKRQRRPLVGRLSESCGCNGFERDPAGDHAGLCAVARRGRAGRDGARTTGWKHPQGGRPRGRS